MTLILTTICKDGICVCADKRYKIIGSDGSIKFEDTHSKIYKFEKIPYIILNHGINKIDGKDWRVYCSEYENSDRWVGKDHSQIVSDFKEFIDESVKKELSRYKDNEKHAIGFLLGGKPTSESNYKVSEIHWLLEKGEIKFTPPDVIHTRKKNNPIFTGDDIKAYLKKYVKSNGAQYLKMSRAQRVEKKLISLFNLAVKKKQKPDTEDFSNEYDIEIIDG